MSKSMIAWSQENAEEIPALLRDYLDCRHPRTRDALRVMLGDRIASEGGEVDYYSVDGCIKITLQVNLPEQQKSGEKVLLLTPYQRGDGAWTWDVVCDAPVPHIAIPLILGYRHLYSALCKQHNVASYLRYENYVVTIEAEQQKTGAGE